MSHDWTDVVNALIIVLALFCCYYFVRIYYLTKARAALFMVAAFAVSVVVRIGIFWNVEYIDDFSRQAILPAFVLYAIASALLFRSLWKFYHHGGGIQRELDNQARDKASHELDAASTLRSAHMDERDAESSLRSAHVTERDDASVKRDRESVERDERSREREEEGK